MMEELQESYFVSSTETGSINVENSGLSINSQVTVKPFHISAFKKQDSVEVKRQIKPGKYIIMKEDGRVEIVDHELAGDNHWLETMGDFINDKEDAQLDSENMDHDAANTLNLISQHETKANEVLGSSDGNPEIITVDPQFTAKENVTIVHLKGPKQEGVAKIVKGIPERKRVKREPDLPDVDKFTCKYCMKKFTNISNKLRHVRVIHKIKKNMDSDIRCMECCLNFKRLQQLRYHLTEKHNLDMSEQLLTFPNLNAFKKWKCEIERKNLCSYTLRHGSQKTALGPKHFYMCHRSGKYLSKVVDERKRMLRVSGSCKLGIMCTAAIYCQVCPNEVEVRYYPNHYGHGKETAFVQLSPEEQTAIQESVSKGVPFETLLDDIRDSHSKDTFQLLLLKKRDFRWMNSAFNAEEFNPGISDAESVESWVRCCCQMEDSPVLFYQQQDIGSEQEEFMLVIMTEFQKHILYTAKKDVVCVDSLYRRKGGRFYLTVMFVMDEFDNAFPVALCISNKVDKNVIGQFFLSIKESAGTLSFKYFMSDSELYFYETWVSVMDYEPRWLWCIWYVDHKIRTQLKIFKGNVSKRAEVYKTMRMLLECQNESVFQCMFRNFIDNLLNNSLTKNLGNFIINKYGSNTEMWASCYRQEVDLSTNIHLEVMHRTFRYCCREGRKKRLDKFLHVVMKLVKCKMLDRLSYMLDDVKLNLAIDAINMCHSAALDIPAENMSALSEKIWLIQTPEEERPIYVTKELDKCPEHCSLRCDDCDICVHQYSCTCVHSMIEANLCKHIHAVVWKFLTPHFSPAPSPTPSADAGDDEVSGEASSCSKDPDMFESVLKRTHDVYRKIKANRCNLNKDALDSIMKRLDECVDICVGKKVDETNTEQAPVLPNNTTYLLNSYVKGPNLPFILPNPVQTFQSNASKNTTTTPQYVLLLPNNNNNIKLIKP